MSYKVKLNIFEGPLDLLLFLIKKEKIDIYDIPIVSVTRQYLEYLEILRMLDLEVAGDFLVMAATLLHIKSKMLLPKENLSEDELEEEDPRDELVKRLLEYRKYKDAAEQLKDKLDTNKNIFTRKGEGFDGRIIDEDGTEYFEASLFDLITSFRKVLKHIPKTVFHEVVKDRYSVNDKIHIIFHALQERSKITFEGLFSDSKNKDEAIVTFLAVLELIKMQEIVIVQKELFSGIDIMRHPDTVRRAPERVKDTEQ
jgi:segregation and condensation protein A